MNAFDFDRYVASLEQSEVAPGVQIKASTRLAYQNDVRQYCEWLALRDLTVSKAEPALVQEFLDFLALERKPSSVRRAASSLRRLYCYLGAPLPGDQAQRLQLPRRSRAFSRSLPPGAVDDLRRQFDGLNARNARNRAILELLYSCGLRISEIVALDLEEVRLSEQLIRPVGKRGVTRVIPFGGTAAKTLREWILHERSRFLLQSGVSSADEALFVNRQGSRLARQSMQRILGAAGQAAGIRGPVAPHMIRDTCARVMLRNGASRSDVEMLFGHVALVGHKRMDQEAIERLRDVMAHTHPSWSDT